MISGYLCCCDELNECKIELLYFYIRVCNTLLRNIHVSIANAISFMYIGFLLKMQMYVKKRQLCLYN